MILQKKGGSATSGGTRSSSPCYYVRGSNHYYLTKCSTWGAVAPPVAMPNLLALATTPSSALVADATPQY